MNTILVNAYSSSNTIPNSRMLYFIWRFCSHSPSLYLKLPHFWNFHQFAYNGFERKMLFQVTQLPPSKKTHISMYCNQELLFYFLKPPAPFGTPIVSLKIWCFAHIPTLTIILSVRLKLFHEILYLYLHVIKKYKKGGKSCRTLHHSVHTRVCMYKSN